MKRSAHEFSKDLSGRRYWRSLEELDGTQEFEALLQREFPPGAAYLEGEGGSDGVTRRSFLTLMGASMALGGLAACRRPEEKILPYAKAPEEVIPGKPLYFATAMPMMGTAFGLLVESHEGRPTKVEGNPRHPESLGATTTFAQASVLDLYDPDRSRHPLQRGERRSWADAAALLAQLGAAARAQGGKGTAIVTEAHRSPTVARLLEDLTRALSGLKVFRYEPFTRANGRKGAQLAFGQPLETVYDLAGAKVIVSLDADFLATEGSPLRQSRQYAQGRRPEPAAPWHGGHAAHDVQSISRLYVVESRYSITGANADHRLRIPSRYVGAFAAAVARELSTRHGLDLGAGIAAALPTGALPADVQTRLSTWAPAVAKDLLAHRGEGLLLVGSGQPPAVHALVQALNLALGNVGKTLRHVAPFDATPEGPEGLGELVKAIDAKQVTTLLILGGNPVFNAPADVRIGEAVSRVATSVHLSTHFDETSVATTWHLNRAHFLESWGDVRSEDGTASVVQPLIAPMYDGKSDAEVLSMFAGARVRGYELVRETWRTVGAAGVAAGAALGSADKAWRRALHDGLFAQSAYPAQSVTLQPAAVAAELNGLVPAGANDGIELTFHPDFHTWDGRYANSGWLQELPDPLTKLTWGSAALLSSATAQKLGVKDGDLLRIALRSTNGGEAVAQVPALVQPGQADGSISLMVGQGRSQVGRVGRDVGVNTSALRTAAGFYVAAGASVERIVGRSTQLGRTQEHFVMEGRPLVREATIDQYKKDPEVIKKQSESPSLFSLWKEYRYEGHAWGMVVDLNSCTGCGACTIACQAENNIPVVGLAGVLKSREMHWIRVDRYFEGGADEPKSVAQPVMCHHCENAPCEQVCPVGATVHSPEGLNDMAYNRCIGTRYCANNCPYKVRRFNFLNYHKELPETRKAQFNPDVTVRVRGVMEKCTFCVQRINGAKIEATIEAHHAHRLPTGGSGSEGAHEPGDSRVKDGAVVTACQQVCPTEAITFGDLNDPTSRVAHKAKLERSYRMLEELNIRPRLSYAAKLRNPNPELERV
jgi:molybdopterin-containing oxidoreductase family iron-sulfur binding subunit